MLHKLRFSAILLVVFAVTFANGKNILYLCALPSPSHHVWNSALINALAAQGHNVTVISPDIDKKPPKGVHYIHAEGIYSASGFTEKLKTLYEYTANMNPLTESMNYDASWYETCKMIFNTKGFERLLQYPDDFRVDLIVYDMTAGGCLLGFMDKFGKPPLVTVTAYAFPTMMNSMVGGHQYYSYIPHYYLPYEGDMSFWQRILNLFVHIIEYCYHKYIFNGRIDELNREKFGPNVSPVNELEQRTAIAFVNTNPTFDFLTPLPENIIPVGGLQIRKVKSLPKDVEEFITASPKGAVLFSLGTNVLSNLMDSSKQQILLDAFAQLPDYHFLWKFEEQINLKLPKNVQIRPWLPQSDILAHPKLKAFITHSGMLSTQETIWRGVPVVGMPFAYDQHRNLKISKRLGFAEDLDYHTLTTARVVEKLRKVLEDPKYAENAKRLSARFRDQKETPLQRAIWWIEWVLRNPDCEYLKSPVLRIGYFVGNSFDVIGFVTLVFIVFLMTIVWCCRWCSRRSVTKTKLHEKIQ